MSNLIKDLSVIRNKENKFIERPELIKGYSNNEILEIEQRYNITISGQLKEWLVTLGKNSGGLLLGGNMTIYRSTTKPTSEYFGKKMQEAWQNEKDYAEFLRLINHINLVEKQFLLLADDDQVYFYFMLTADKDDLVYLYYDEEPETIKILGTVFDFLKSYRKYEVCCVTGEDDETYYKLTTGRLL